MAIPVVYNFRSVRQRWPSAIVAVLGIAGTVGVFVAMLSLARGFRADLAGDLAQPRQFQLPTMCCEATLPLLALVIVASIVPDCWLRSMVNVTLSPSLVCQTLDVSVLCISTVIPLLT